MQENSAVKNKGNKWWAVFLVAFAVCYILLVRQYGDISAVDSLMFLLAQIVFALIPGMALMLLVGDVKSRVKFIISSYLLGIGAVILQYFVFCSAGLKDHLFICMTAVSAVCVGVIFLKREKFANMKADNTGAWAFSVLAASMCLLVFFQTIQYYQTPYQSGAELTGIYQDLTWNMGNVAALKQGLPIQDIHISGISFGYHYLPHAFLAAFQNMMGYSSFVLYIKFFPVVAALVLCGGLYLLVSEIFQNRWVAAGAAALAAFTSYITMSHMLWYAFATPLGAGLAAAAAGFFMRYIKKIDTEKFWDRDFLLFLVFLALTAGSKAPYAMPLLAGAGMLLIIQIFRKKNISQMLLAGVLTFAAFAAVYLGLAWGTHGFNAFERGFATMLLGEGAPQYYLDALAAMPNLPETLVRLIVYPWHLIQNYSVIVASFLALLIYLIRAKNADKKIPQFFFFGVLLSTVIGSVLSQPGQSNLFFLDAAQIFGTAALLWLLYVLLKGTGKKARKITISCLLAAALVYSSASCVRNIANESNMLATKGVDVYNSISYQEYEGMLWLKDNSEEDAVFVSDRQFYNQDETTYFARYYYYTAFSERNCYLEGFNYINTFEEDYEEIIDDRLNTVNRIYQYVDADAVKKVKDEGADYIVVTRNKNPEFELPEELGSIVFDNWGMTIYKLV